MPYASGAWDISSTHPAPHIDLAIPCPESLLETRMAFIPMPRIVFKSSIITMNRARKSPATMLLDGHASTHMHVLWGSLGAAMADEKDLREYLDYIKWWMIMAQTHDGGFVIMPGRDYASTDHVYGTRNFPTACAAFILSIKEKRLRITGASGSADQAGESSSIIPASRQPRKLSAGQKPKLDQALLNSLGELRGCLKNT